MAPDFGAKFGAEFGAGFGAGLINYLIIYLLIQGGLLITPEGYVLLEGETAMMKACKEVATIESVVATEVDRRNPKFQTFH